MKVRIGLNNLAVKTVEFVSTYSFGIEVRDNGTKILYPWHNIYKVEYID